MKGVREHCDEMGHGPTQALTVSLTKALTLLPLRHCSYL